MITLSIIATIKLTYTTYYIITLIIIYYINYIIYIYIYINLYYNNLLLVLPILFTNYYILCY